MPPRREPAERRWAPIVGPAAPGGSLSLVNADTRPIPAAPELAALVHAGVMDAELAALLWLLVEVRTPVIVVGERGLPGEDVVDAIRPLLPLGTQVVPVTATDDFERMPEAVELGWRRERPTTPIPSTRVSAATAVLEARDLGDQGAGGPAGERARIIVRALSLGYGLLATMRGTGLDDVLNRLNDASIGTDEQERSRLGVVIALEPAGNGGPLPVRVAAAHYVRPVSRDQHGHVQHLPPAVLATWNAAAGRFDHFAWGVLPDLASRIGMRPIELEREQARRAATLRTSSAPPRAVRPAL